jgi:hypothetical protein
MSGIKLEAEVVGIRNALTNGFEMGPWLQFICMAVRMSMAGLRTGSTGSTPTVSLRADHFKRFAIIPTLLVRLQS